MDLSDVLGKMNGVIATTKIGMSTVRYSRYDVQSIDRNQRRWVEYADYFLPIGIGGDRIPPGWHGWLSHQYDDHPEVHITSLA